MGTDFHHIRLMQIGVQPMCELNAAANLPAKFMHEISCCAAVLVARTLSVLLDQIATCMQHIWEQSTISPQCQSVLMQAGQGGLDAHHCCKHSQNAQDRSCQQQRDDMQPESYSREASNDVQAGCGPARPLVFRIVSQQGQHVMVPLTAKAQNEE